MKKILKKLLISICLFLTLLNFITTSNYVYSATESTEFETGIGEVYDTSGGGGVSNDIMDIIASTLSGIVGLLTWGIRLPFAIVPLIVQSVGGAIAKMDGRTPGSSSFVFLTPYHIIFNQINLTSINFFDFSIDSDSATYVIREQISLWYYIMRIIAIAILLGILIFVGIKMAITTVASEKAIYKKALFDWATSLALVFLLHYIIRGVLWLNTGLVKIFNSIAQSTELDSLFSEMAKLMFNVDFLTATTAIIVYIMIAIQTLMFLISYIKRMLTLAFLIIISPLITITYSIDKMGDQKAQALNTWLKEFSYNVLIQPFHCVLYLAFVDVALGLIKGGSGVNKVAASVLAILCIKFVWDGEKIVRKIFGFEQASSLAAAAASGAVIGSMISKAQNVGKGAATGIKFAKNSKTGQLIKNKHNERKETRMKNKEAKKLTGDKNATYASLNNSQKKEADKLAKHKMEQKNKTPIRRLQEKKEYNRLKKKAENSGANIRDSVLREKAAKNVDKKKLDFKNNHKILSALGTDAKRFTRNLVSPEKIAKYTTGAVVAAAMSALPETNLVTSIGAGYAAGKSAEGKIKNLKNNKKEHFEENIIKAWNNHCNINGGKKDSMEDFNRWYNNTYLKGKQLDHYSQKNIGKSENSARKELQEAGVQQKDIDAIISQLQKAILTKEDYDPSKLFAGFQDANNRDIDPAVIAAALAAYATQYNESYAYKNASDYNTQMEQFGVTADDAVNGITDSELESYLTPPVQTYTAPEQTEEVVETSVNTSEQFENEQLELVSEDLEEVYNIQGEENADLDSVFDMLHDVTEGKLKNIEAEIRNNLINIGNDQENKLDSIINEIKTSVSNINPEMGRLESQISNIVNSAMSKIDLRGVDGTKLIETRQNLTQYANSQVVNNYITNNYETSNSNYNADKIRSDLEKIANKNK